MTAADVHICSIVSSQRWHPSLCQHPCYNRPSLCPSRRASSTKAISNGAGGAVISLVVLALAIASFSVCSLSTLVSVSVSALGPAGTGTGTAGGGGGGGGGTDISSSSSSGGSKIIALDDSTFGEKISTGEWIIAFTAPWCGHCKTLVPIWEELSVALAANPKPVYVGKVDVTTNPTVAKKQSIRGYPTIKYYNGYVVREYEGARTLVALLDWVDAQRPSNLQGKNPKPGAAAAAEHDRATKVATEAAQAAAQAAADKYKHDPVDKFWRAVDKVSVFVQSFWLRHPWLCAVLLVLTGMWLGFFLGVCVAVREKNKVHVQ